MTVRDCMRQGATGFARGPQGSSPPHVSIEQCEGQSRVHPGSILGDPVPCWLASVAIWAGPALAQLAFPWVSLAVRFFAFSSGNFDLLHVSLNCLSLSFPDVSILCLSQFHSLQFSLFFPLSILGLYFSSSSITFDLGNFGYCLLFHRIRYGLNRDMQRTPATTTSRNRP